MAALSSTLTTSFKTARTSSYSSTTTSFSISHVYSLIQTKMSTICHALLDFSTDGHILSGSYTCDTKTNLNITPSPTTVHQSLLWSTAQTKSYAKFISTQIEKQYQSNITITTSSHTFYDADSQTNLIRTLSLETYSNILGRFNASTSTTPARLTLNTVSSIKMILSLFQNTLSTIYKYKGNIFFFKNAFRGRIGMASGRYAMYGSAGASRSTLGNKDGRIIDFGTESGDTALAFYDEKKSKKTSLVAKRFESVGVTSYNTLRNVDSSTCTITCKSNSTSISNSTPSFTNLISLKNYKSDIPTFDCSLLTGTNGKYDFYCLVDVKPYQLTNIDEIFEMFDITQSTRIEYSKVYAAIEFIYQDWLTQLQSCVCSYYVCHYNCHGSIQGITYATTTGFSDTAGSLSAAQAPSAETGLSDSDFTSSDVNNILDSLDGIDLTDILTNTTANATYSKLGHSHTGTVSYTQDEDKTVSNISITIDAHSSN